jgi:hypothetical protein
MSMNNRLEELEASCSWIQAYVSSSQHRQADRTATGANVTTDYLGENASSSDNTDNGDEEQDDNISSNMNPNPTEASMILDEVEIDRPVTANERSDASTPLQSSAQQMLPPSLRESQRPNSVQNPRFPLHVAAQTPSASRGKGKAVASLSASVLVPLSSRVDLTCIRREIAFNNGAAFRPSFDVFFQYLNPLHPVLNENQFRQDFDNLVFGQDESQWGLLHTQVVALALLVHSEVKILNEPWTSPEETPGWRQYCTAEELISELLWRGTADLRMVQCLILKARYLLYLQRIHQARDTVAVVVRLCFQIRLQDQSLWNDETNTSFDFVMSQRIFWCVFTIERAVSMSCGMPPMLKLSDCSVNLPKAIDDRCLFPNRPAPGPTPESSFIPYFLALIKWAELWDVLWNKILSHKISDATWEQAISALDATISLLTESLPNEIQWRAPAGSILPAECVELWTWRQRFYFMMVS